MEHMITNGGKNVILELNFSELTVLATLLTETGDLTTERIRQLVGSEFGSDVASQVGESVGESNAKLDGICRLVNAMNDMSSETESSPGFLPTPQNVMKVEKPLVFVVRNSGKLRGMASINVGDIRLNSLRIYEWSKGLFVSYPNDPAHQGEDYRQLFYPMTAELRAEIENVILTEYDRMIAGEG